MVAPWLHRNGVKPGNVRPNPHIAWGGRHLPLEVYPSPGLGP